MTTLNSAPAPASPRSPLWKQVAVWAGCIAVIAIAIAVFALTRNRGSANASESISSQRIAATQTACEHWLSDSAASTATPDPSWCAGMTTWMYGQVSTGPMMNDAPWRNPQAMLAACKQWSATSGSTPTADPKSAGWCQQMVTWMTDHMDGWHDGQDWDNHMDDWGNGMMDR